MMQHGMQFEKGVKPQFDSAEKPPIFERAQKLRFMSNILFSSIAYRRLFLGSLIVLVVPKIAHF